MVNLSVLLLSTCLSPSIHSLAPTPVERIPVNQMTWYYGGRAGHSPATLSPHLAPIASRFGVGVYLVDDARARTVSPALYETTVAVDRVIDADQPISAEIPGLMTKAMPEEIHAEILAAAAARGATLRTVWTAMAEALSEHSHGEFIPESEFVENFQTLAAHLREAGYDAVSYGAERGGIPHRVLVVLDPNAELTQFSRDGVAGNTVSRSGHVVSMRRVR